MLFIFYLFLFLVFLGLVGVISNSSPKFAALSLVVAAVGGCGLLACLGQSLLSLILVLIYLGGMLVVFSYSVAFTASVNVKNWEEDFSWELAAVYGAGLGVCGGVFVGFGWFEEFWVTEAKLGKVSLISKKMVGAPYLYDAGWGFLILGALALLLALLVVLLVVRGADVGAVRAL